MNENQTQVISDKGNVECDQLKDINIKEVREDINDGALGSVKEIVEPDSKGENQINVSETETQSLLTESKDKPNTDPTSIFTGREFISSNFTTVSEPEAESVKDMKGISEDKIKYAVRGEIKEIDVEKSHDQDHIVTEHLKNGIKESEKSQIESRAFGTTMISSRNDSGEIFTNDQTSEINSDSIKQNQPLDVSSHTIAESRDSRVFATASVTAAASVASIAGSSIGAHADVTDSIEEKNLRSEQISHLPQLEPSKNHQFNQETLVESLTLQRSASIKEEDQTHLCEDVNVVVPVTATATTLDQKEPGVQQRIISPQQETTKSTSVVASTSTPVPAVASTSSTVSDEPEAKASERKRKLSPRRSKEREMILRRHGIFSRLVRFFQWLFGIKDKPKSD